jgi:hypothetical protein
MLDVYVVNHTCIMSKPVGASHTEYEGPFVKII